MPNIGLRDLKNQTAEILRIVREEHTEYVVTHYGRPVAVILPFEQYEQQSALQKKAADAAVNHQIEEEWDVLRTRVARAWHTDLSAVEAVEEQRR